MDDVFIDGTSSVIATSAAKTGARLTRRNFNLVGKIMGQSQGLCALELAAVLACQEKYPLETSKCNQHLKDFDKCMKLTRKTKGKGSSLLFHLSRITGAKR